MLLNENSWTHRLYNWFYCIHCWESLPTDGCIYFRKLIWMFIIIIPYCILSLPLLIVNLVVSKSYEIPIRYSAERLLMGVVLPVMFIGVCLFLFLITYPIWFYTGLVYSLELFNAFYAIWISVIIISMVLGIVYSIDKLKYSRKPSKFMQIYKSFKDKYCIKIEWIKKEKE